LTGLFYRSLWDRNYFTGPLPVQAQAQNLLLQRSTGISSPTLVP